MMRMKHINKRGEENGKRRRNTWKKRRKMIEKTDWLIDQAVYKFVWADGGGDKGGGR